MPHLAATGSPTGQLNAKQARFVEEYLIDLNAKQAAIRAGYSAKAAAAVGSRLLTHANVSAAIAARRETRTAQRGISHDRVLAELARVAFFDIRKAFAADGTLLPMSEMDEDTAGALLSVESFDVRDADGNVTGTVRKVKFPDKVRALELLMRHLGMLNDKLNVRGDAENPLRLLVEQIQGAALRPSRQVVAQFGASVVGATLRH